MTTGSPNHRAERPIHPAVQDAHELLLLEQQARRQTRPTDDHYRRLWRAVMLAPTLEICRALLHDEAVPITRLDPLWVRRFGRRDQQQAAA